MKVMAIVTCILAPATVIGGIFGMNFKAIEYIDAHSGFAIAAILMISIPLIMIYIFKKRGWF
jgi:magnesium transporter